MSWYVNINFINQNHTHRSSENCNYVICFSYNDAEQFGLTKPWVFFGREVKGFNNLKGFLENLLDDGRWIKTIDIEGYLPSKFRNNIKRFLDKKEIPYKELN